MSALLALALVIVAALVLVLRGDSGTIAGFDKVDFAALMGALAMLIYLGGSLLRGYRGGLIGVLRDAVAWAAIALILVVLYSFRNDLVPLAERLVGELMPGVPVSVSTPSDDRPVVRIRRQLEGQFIARTAVNGAAVSMIVDTGASTVVLRPDDARRAGIATESLSYTVPVQTANGRSYAAQVRLTNVSIGAVVIFDVEALVARPDALHHSLLGMSFLSRLRSYEFSGDFLTLRS